MPDVLIRNLQNYRNPTVHFSEFKKKLVILDFWFGRCPGCLELFQRAEALQAKFKDSIQVLTINFEARSFVDTMFGKLKHVSHIYRVPNLPSIYSDTLFHKLFSFREYPHEVWIDGNGVVRAFTSSHDVTETNIHQMLAGKKVNMDIKIDDLVFDNAAPSLPQFYQRNKEPLSYSCILPYLRGTNLGARVRRFIDTVSKTVRVTRANMSVLALFGNAIDIGDGDDPFETPDFDFGKRVILQVKDSNRYFYRKESGLTTLEWKEKNCYRYESVFPLDREPLIFHYMLDDLERYFDMSCRVEKRKMKCLALVRISDKDKIKSTRLPPSGGDPSLDSNKLQMFSFFTGWVVDRIASANREVAYTFVDNTGYMGRVDIALDKSRLSNILALREQLRKDYDLDLVETEQEVDVLALSENSFVNTRKDLSYH